MSQWHWQHNRRASLPRQLQVEDTALQLMIHDGMSSHCELRQAAEAVLASAPPAGHAHTCASCGGIGCPSLEDEAWR